MTTGCDIATEPAKLVVSTQALALATRHATEAVPLETGGILVGWWESNIAVVHDLLLVPDRKAGRWYYKRSHRLAQQILDSYAASADAHVGYLGEWHSHPAPEPPSERDLKELAAIVRQSGARAAQVVLSVNADRTAQLTALIGSPQARRRVHVDSVPVERTVP